MRKIEIGRRMNHLDGRGNSENIPMMGRVGAKYAPYME